MLMQVHPTRIVLQGDGRGYNPRHVIVRALTSGEELLIGTFVDDGDREGRPRRPNRPFWITIPADFEGWRALNTRIFYSLQNDSGEVVICCRPQPEHVLVCPTCGTVVSITEHPIFGPPYVHAVELATCSGCGRGFTPPEIDERGTWL